MDNLTEKEKALLFLWLTLKIAQGVSLNGEDLTEILKKVRQDLM